MLCLSGSLVATLFVVVTFGLAVIAELVDVELGVSVDVDSFPDSVTVTGLFVDVRFVLKGNVVVDSEDPHCHNPTEERKDN